MGWAIHLVIGVTLSLVYAAVLVVRLPGPPIIRGVTCRCSSEASLDIWSRAGWSDRSMEHRTPLRVRALRRPGSPPTHRWQP